MASAGHDACEHSHGLTWDHESHEQRVLGGLQLWMAWHGSSSGADACGAKQHEHCTTSTTMMLSSIVSAVMKAMRVTRCSLHPAPAAVAAGIMRR